jgi:hypothetical protein
MFANADENGIKRQRSVGPIHLRRWRSGFFLEAAQLVFKLGHAHIKALQDFTHVGGKHDPVRAVLPGGIAALDGVFELFPAGAAGAGTLAGGDLSHGREFNSKSEARNPKSEAFGWKQPGDLFFRAINFRKGFPNMR